MAGALLAGLLTSCFTGIESTPKVSISRHDQRAMLAARENAYLDTIKAMPLGEWESGKQFYAADNRVLLTFIQRDVPLDIDSIRLEGRLLTYDGQEATIRPNGSISTAIRLRDGDALYRLDTGKEKAKALSEFNSFALDMLIDIDAVSQADRLMRGNVYWTRSPLWYSSDLKSIRGRKFIPVTVDSVTVGNSVFPLRVHFTDDTGIHASMLMNFNDSGSRSRLFASLFFLDDVRKRYPSIKDDVWQLIQSSSVREGMTKEECRLSLGYPVDVDSGTTGSYAIEIWQYDGGRFLKFVDGLLSQFRL